MSTKFNWRRAQLHGRPPRSLKNEQDRWIAKLFAEHDPRVVERALMRLVDSLHSWARTRAARKRSRGACTQRSVGRLRDQSVV